MATCVELLDAEDKGLNQAPLKLMAGFIFKCDGLLDALHELAVTHFDKLNHYAADCLTQWLFCHRQRLHTSAGQKSRYQIFREYI